VKNLFTLLEARVRALAERASEVAKCTQELTQKGEDKDAHIVEVSAQSSPAESFGTLADIKIFLVFEFDVPRIYRSLRVDRGPFK